MTDITELAQREKFEVWAHSQKLSFVYGDCSYAFSSTEMACGHGWHHPLSW